MAQSSQALLKWNGSGERVIIKNLANDYSQTANSIQTQSSAAANFFSTTPMDLHVPVILILPILSTSGPSSQVRGAQKLSPTRTSSTLQIQRRLWTTLSSPWLHL